MRKFLALSLLLGSMAFAASSVVEAKTTGENAKNAVEPNAAQQYGRWQRNKRNRRARVVTRTRIIRIGGRLYRETYQIRYLPNGRTQIRILSRVRVR